MWDGIKKFFKENYKLIIATFLIGLLAHGFAITNKLIADTNTILQIFITFSSFIYFMAID